MFGYQDEPGASVVEILGINAMYAGLFALCVMAVLARELRANDAEEARGRVKAVVYDRYGPPTCCGSRTSRCRRPPPGRCASRSPRRRSTSATGSACAARPLYARIGGLRTPARRTLGSDIAGVVDAVGAGVTRFRPGDEVYGDNLALKGGFAEYARRARVGARPQAGGADVRRGVDHPAGGRDRAPGHRAAPRPGAGC